MRTSFYYAIFTLSLLWATACFTPIGARGENILPEPWISYPSASVTDYGVFHFRRSFSLDKVPDQLVVHVSADNRYHLFVNGTRVCYGPAKGDLHTYKYDVVDIAPYLSTGENVVAALVYNAGKDKPMSLLSVQTAFMLRTPQQDFDWINTNARWKVYKNPAYTPVSYDEMLFKNRWFYGYYACGPGDDVDGTRYPWGWESRRFDDTAWLPAELLEFDGPPPWQLVARNIPWMDAHLVLPKKIRIVENAAGAGGFLDANMVIRIAANTSATLLVDFEVLTMGYPELSVSGGSGSSIKIKYAEALYEKVNLKAHRDSVSGLTMFGVWDVFRPDGAARTFRPLWKRTFRYVQFEVTTGSEPLEIAGYSVEYSGYPYTEMATFRCDDERINEIFEMGLRTLGMCSGETYYDTPFYEQLSYGGDNRPIAALSTYNSTDDRLLREMLRLYPQSVNNSTGLLKSAYPSRFDFDQGTWSLAWIQSMHDYYFMRGDREFVLPFVERMEGILGFYHRHMDESMGILGDIKCRNFMDWSITTGNIPRADEAGVIRHSTLLTFYYLHTLECVNALYKAIGQPAIAEKWEKEAAVIRQGLKKYCWDSDLQLFRDRPGEAIYSQHSNLLAILTNVVPANEQGAMMQRILEWNGFDEVASSYFSFYLFKAMQQTGREDLFLDHLDFWQQFIDRGLTTCGETGFASHDRSDCHAWAAHPSYYLLSMVCGIQPGDTGFDHVRIEPHPGRLKEVRASMPHPKGRLEVEFRKKGNKLTGTVTLPVGMTGIFNYGDTTKELRPGVNTL